MEGTHLKINNCSYYVRDSHNGHSSVILLHGWPDDGSLWKFQIPTLIEAGYRVICLDWLGHGKSEKVENLNKYTVSSLSTDIITLIDLLELKKVHCVAHDYGAVVAWELVTKYPEYLLSYTALSVGHPLIFVKNLSLESIIKSWYLFFNPLPISVPIYRARNGLFLKWVLRSHPDREVVVKKFLSEKRPFYIQVWEQANPVFPVLVSAFGNKGTQLDLIKVPTLGVWSSQDSFMSEEQMKKSGTLIQAEWEYKKIPNCNHWLQLEKSEEFNELLLKWLDKHSQVN
ncbi:alpha/beta fold hydrolase [Oscillatoria salina]|uniref:alpha/beta fold hydrolase n=1 Tax=Oscillatoria salina TaxID=331517 RepID=UPI0013BBA756|nr:alpha/beta hydrolase [Oscillatoria salina]MBZ8181715.1 alpha/beta hydrolase [Oscillatoria salina IIICB1]NET91414.1 alpha/beta hydrolase [Kamptonema sp. SIO1D9]